MNIINESKNWISNCNGNLENVLCNFGQFLESNNQEIISSIGKENVDIFSIFEEVKNNVSNITNNYHIGNIRESLEITKTLLIEDFYIEIPTNTPLFRARCNESGFLYKKEEMFHIPFDKRYIIGNQRYSISGLPCLYLGGSPYICWEALGRPDYQRCNFNGFNNKKNLYIYDFCLPKEIHSLNDIIRITLILACSIPANPNHIFKEQYILPQCIFQAMIDKHYNNGEMITEERIFGIRYLSTHFLKGETDMFDFDTNDETKLSRIMNYVLPSVSKNTEGLSQSLSRAFSYTEPTSIMHLSITEPGFSIKGGKDNYATSMFGSIEDNLREKLGAERITEDLHQVFYKYEK